MAQPGKASIKRGKPSYFMSILGVTLVLFVLGLIGWLIISANKLGSQFKENVEVKAILRGDLKPGDSAALMSYISSQPYVKSVTFVNKEEARKIYLSDGNDDFGKVLDFNPLPNAIYFKMKEEYLHPDTLKSIKATLEQQTYVSEVEYQQALVEKLNDNIKKISLILLVIAVILAIVVIVLIDNTIRLAMFSNRFLIKTMQMVGATRMFIAKPMNTKAIINGLISGVLASLAVILGIGIAEKFVPEMKAVHDNRALTLLFIMLILLGIGITLISTYRSVNKYIKMKLDDLY
jgi:cell division transport system permease protein